MVVGLRCQLRLGIGLHLGYQDIIAGEGNVLDQQWRRLVEVALAGEHDLRVAGNGGPAVLRNFGVVGGGHCEDGSGGDESGANWR